MTLPLFADAIRVAAEAFDRLGIPYLVGGSVATVVHGEPRNTQDADIVIDIAFTQIDALAAALQEQFFADAESTAWNWNAARSCRSVPVAWSALPAQRIAC